MKKKTKIFLLSVIGLLLLCLFWPVRTPGIKSASDKSIAIIDYIEIGGIEQCVLIRAKNKENPLLLFLHGGPGMPLMFRSHEFQKPLEENFTVVQWDRRGAGKTYVRNAPPAETINVRQILDDSYELIDTLKSRYNKNKVILVGHSFGTYLGSIMVTERPDLFHSYISVGQVVDNSKERDLQEKFIREKAKLAGREDIIEELDKSTNPNLENWLFEFGGELKNHESFLPLLWSGILAPEYSLLEVLKVGEASSFSSLNMTYNVLPGSIYSTIRKYEIPVYFFIGKYDYTTPHALVTEYFTLVEAPKKEIIYFEDSAHFPFFEEPEAFCSEIKRILLRKTEL